jgi:hydroxymethylbilane synthase
MAPTIRIGTRGSKLALFQSRWVQAALQQQYPHETFILVTIKTTGDKILNSPLSQMPDKGVFTKELDNALLANEIDMAVHSLKDVPTALTDGIVLAAITEREEVEDALISPGGKKLAELPDGSTLATSSLRRQAQLLHVRPDFKIVDIRGNVDTRLRKLEENNWAGIVLAVAGLKRLGLADKITEKLPLDVMLPAVGQGSFAIVCRSDDYVLRERLQFLHHQPSALATRAERALLKELEGGCHVPIGAFGKAASTLHLSACLGSLDGRRLIRDSVEGALDNPEKLGIALAQKLVAQGGKEILAHIRSDKK